MLHSSKSQLPELGRRLFYRSELLESNRCTSITVSSSCFTTSKLDTNRRLGELFKSGKAEEARQVFVEMPERDAFSWNTMVVGYANLGRLNEAREILYETPYKSSITWNSLISGYCQHGKDKEAFELLWQMQRDGFKPTSFTVGSVLGMCSKLGLIQRGEQFHSYAMKTQLDSNVFVVTALVDMYAKCNCIIESEYVFEMVPNKSSCALWTAMLTGYSRNGCGLKAMECFRSMLMEGIEPNQFTYPCILTACAAVLALYFGKQVHGCILKCGLGDNMFVESALVDMYAKCRDLDSAREVLENEDSDNSNSWNSMIVGCVREGLEEEALSLFKRMHTRNIRVDDYTFPSILNCFASKMGTKSAEFVHSLVMKGGFENYNLVCNALVDMYAKQGNIDCALKVFNAMPNKDVISWTSLVTGYTHNGLYDEALGLFCDMRKSGIFADEYVASSILSACAELTILVFGQQLHAVFIKSGLRSCQLVDNSLVNMYAKCGCIEDAVRIFDNMQVHELITWTSLIVGYSRNGQGKQSVRLYEEMVASGVTPDSVTFIGLLFACSHAGLEENGKHYFEAMDKVYGIKPGPEHYACMIDLFARSGKMVEAEKLLNQMAVHPDGSAWKSLLAACRVHGNIKLAERAATNLFESEPSNAVPYMLLANIYSAAGRWEEAASVRRLMKLKGINKEPGCSWMEMNGRVHAFTSEDRSHPMMAQIYSKVDEIIILIKKVGYVPDKNFALHDTDDERKELSVAYHSEKLAVAFGLLISSPGVDIRIFKNIRVCGDCHAAMKYISEVYNRHIILRDSNCFHHFLQGRCSCNNYW
ncbi:hypothetical protein Nepgr_002377 [Nepenthes gracilis]|uniref:DYW domain-containing protein n=1 Tax=Nepenthes gracilis TaxID=150966 RepID=A0AAD3P6U7_NEPGR|nr:hypothetical protein Nepgr_002377 [Nepenthes gracilis]